MIVGDGQISLGQTVIKSNICKVRRLSPVAQDVICGFAVSTANAFTLLERLDRGGRGISDQLLRWIA